MTYLCMKVVAQSCKNSSFDADVRQDTSSLFASTRHVLVLGLISCHKLHTRFPTDLCNYGNKPLC